jgi:hypothetical protein
MHAFKRLDSTGEVRVELPSETRASILLVLRVADARHQGSAFTLAK